VQNLKKKKHSFVNLIRLFMASFCQQLCLLSGLFLRISLASFSTHSSSCPPEASLALPSETEKVLNLSFEVAVV